MLQLRDYQLRAVEGVFADWQTVPSTLVVSPTGTGKTILMCGVVRRAFPMRTMILAHRQELILQAADKVRRFVGLDVEIEMGEAKAAEGGLFGGAPVVVSSIQTQNAGGEGNGRMSRFDPSQFAVLIVDEAHHATADSYRRVIDYYRAGNPDIRILGVTATPDRADEQALGQVFDAVAFDYEILDAINDGWLVPVTQRTVEVNGLDFSGIRTTAGDLNGRDLAEVMEYEENLHRIATPTMEIAGARKALVFAASVAHAERLAEIFQRHGKKATWVCGTTPKDERAAMLADYAAGKYQIIVNVGCLTEGFDDPGVELVVIGRPTKSRALYAQMVGRGTRILPDVVEGVVNSQHWVLPTPELRRQAIAESRKPHVEVLDFAGNAGRHKLMTCADILGGKEADEVVERAAKKAREGGAPVDVREALDEAAREIDEERRREAARRARLTARATWEAQTVDPFDVLAIHPTRAKGWENGKQLTAKQADLLRKQGIEPEGKPYHECKQILDELFRRWDGNLCSFKQAKHLQKYGLPTDLTRDQAKAVLDGIWGKRQSPQIALQVALSEHPAQQEVADVPF